MVEWYHWLNGLEFEQTQGDSEGQGSLVCCSSQGCKEPYMTEWTTKLVLTGYKETVPYLKWRFQLQPQNFPLYRSTGLKMSEHLQVLDSLSVLSEKREGWERGCSRKWVIDKYIRKQTQESTEGTRAQFLMFSGNICSIIYTWILMINNFNLSG